MREPASNIEWQLFGKLDVGVSREYDSGIAEWAILKSHLQHYGLQRWDTACEIGCGAGRMTNAVAADFDVVHGLEVSEERILQARSAPNAAKCVFHLVSKATIPLPNESCDLLYSIHVFQHFSSKRVVETYYREAHRVLRPGGVLILHLPMVGAHGFSGELGEVLKRSFVYALRSATTATTRLLVHIGLGKMVAGAGRLLQRLGVREFSGGASIYRVFSFVEELGILNAIGFERIELRILHVRDYNSCVFAVKKSTAPLQA